jgi:hypothetical protein
MLDFNLPLLTDAGAADIGANIGAAATSNVLKLAESSTGKAVVWGTLALLGGWLALRFYAEVRRGAVKHEVVHRGAVGSPPVSPPTSVGSD